MQITKIISGGQTGADQAALDAAIEMGIDHGGWVPKGRLTEDGPLPENYNLTEMPTDSYSERTEKNFLESDATVIFSHGPLTGGSQLTFDLARKQGKPCLHIDLSQMHALKASSELHKWIVDNRVRILNVAGSRASKDPAIYDDTYKAIQGMLILDTMGAQHGPNAGTFNLENIDRKTVAWPETVEKAIETLEGLLSLQDKVRLSQMQDDELGNLHVTLGSWIRDNFGLWRGNDKLLKSAEAWAGRQISSADDASATVIRALAQRLRRTHRLRVVK